MLGGHGVLCPPRLKKWGDTSTVSPTKLRLWLLNTNILAGTAAGGDC